MAVKRLSKVAREFNVGLSTIVDFLKSKDISIESKPITKLPEGAYELLQQEYSSEKDIKTRSIAVSEQIKSTRSAIQEEAKEEIKTVKRSKKEKVSEPKEEKLIEESLEDAKIEVKPKKEPEKIQEDKEEPEKILEQNNSEKEVPEIKEDEKKVQEEELLDVDNKEKSKSNYINFEVAEVDENANPDEPRVIGKIDLNSINQKTRPSKKTKKEKEKEVKSKKVAAKKVPKEAKNTAETPKKEKNNTPKKEQLKEKTEVKKVVVEQVKPKVVKEKATEHVEKATEHVETKITKLEGPKVLGKMELPVEKSFKKTQAEKDEEKKKRKKRKRIKKDVNSRVNVKKEGEKTKTTGLPKKKANYRKPVNRVKKTEIKEVDVQKQIKDTLARLTNKKSKGVKHRRGKRDAQQQKQIEETERLVQEEKILKVTEFVTVNELATMMNVGVTQVISACMGLGLFVSINQRLDAETMSLVSDEFGYEIEFVSAEVLDAIEEEIDDEESLIERPPIITVMGHVDHGKTRLLDHIRSANVIDGEAGGITQHIGAYSVKMKDGKQITFLDTPGHEAFTAMRARGAQITDIAIIVIAADDSIMPQTVEAINHAQAAGVPIVFAINKIDKPSARPEKVKEELANMNILVEDWGGKFQSQEISAKQGINIEELLEKVLLESELLELKANPEKRAIGTVVESSLDKGRGYVTTLLVQSGTLKVGDFVLAGQYTGAVKAMFDESGRKIKIATPSTPVLVLGLNGAPQAGDNFNVLASEKEAKDIANKRAQLQREQGLRTTKHLTLEEIGRRLAIGNFKELNIIVKGDVDGSIEALSDSLIKLSTEEIQVNVIHKAVGQISESDIMLATASDAIILGFQVRPSVSARRLAEKEEIDIRLYSIIYDAINEIKDAMEGMLSPEIKEEILGSAEIRETFKITKVGTIAGCMVSDGKIIRGNKIRVIRDGIVVYDGELGSLKRFKDDVKEVSHGYECGLNVDKFNDIKVGDVIESYKNIEVKKTLK